jgi:hypothetical protein
MGKASSAGGPLLTLLRRLVRPLDGKTWVATGTFAFCAIVGLVTYHLWRHHSDEIMALPRYRLNPDKMKVTPQPNYIRSNVIDSAVAHGRLHDANLLEPEIVLQIKQAFGVQPWVRRVLRVNKKYPSTVEVDLEYRRPVAMVITPPGMFPPYNYEGLVPVDEEGHLLPDELTAEEAQAYPRITGVDSSPSGPPGSPWGDPRLTEAVQIVLLLEESWIKLGLHKVAVPPRPSLTDEPLVDRDYELITRNGRRHAWGPAPGKERPGQPTAQEQARGLKIFAEQHGSLDNWEKLPEARVSELVQPRNLR